MFIKMCNDAIFCYRIAIPAQWFIYVSTRCDHKYFLEQVILTCLYICRSCVELDSITCSYKLVKSFLK